MSVQSLKKIGQKVLKLEHGNKALTDRRTDGLQTDGWTDNYVVSDWNYPACNSIPLLSDTNIYAMHTQNFIEIPLLILKILTKNAF